MILVLVGLAVGLFFGMSFLGHDGSLIGACIGGLIGLTVQLGQRIGSLESFLKSLEEKQLSTHQQLMRLQNTQTSEKTEEPAVVPIKKSSANAINESFNQPATQQKTPEESKSTATISQPITINKAVSAPQPWPPAKTEPDIFEKIFAYVRKFFTESNPIVLVGIVVMFLGVCFLVKYASSQGLLPIEFRLTGVLLGAIALLILGWKTRMREGAYGLVLQGGGIAIIYLTLFAAAKIYGLIPLGAAFGLLFIVVAFGVLLALLQNAQVLAILATAGGFLAPIITATGDGNHVGLFSFYLILNFGILAIAVYKAWRLLNWVGFMFTFVITTAWGVMKYEPALYASTQPFLIAFFALYLTVAILFSFKQPANLKGFVDGSLVFGLPLVAFGLQTLLLKDSEYGLAISSLMLATIYLLLSAGLARKYLQTHRVLIESFLALGVSFATLTVPLALDASWTSVTWALEATGLVWVGLRQQRLRPRVVGYLLHIGAAVSLTLVNGVHTGSVAIIRGDFLALALLSLTSLVIAYLLHYVKTSALNSERLIARIAIAVGIMWWIYAGISELVAHIVAEHQLAAIIAFISLSALSFMQVSKKLKWMVLGNSVYTLLPLMILLSAVAFGGLQESQNYLHPSHGFGFLAIAIFLIVQYRFLFNEESIPNPSTNKKLLLSAWHVITAWLIFTLIFWEVYWQKEHLHLHGTAAVMIWFAALTLPVIMLIGAGQKKIWPFVTFAIDYKNWVPAPLFFLSGLWFFSVCLKTLADSEHYLPILNALDIAQFAIILIFAYAIKREFMDRATFISKQMRVSLLGIMLFIWVNIVTLRAMSHYQNILYDFDMLWDATQVQMALSILWSMCALIVMNLSRRVHIRELWMVGAGLLALVVIKLFTIDLTGSGTLARIVSFLVVGGLMLLIGFISPIPAKPKEIEE